MEVNLSAIFKRFFSSLNMLNGKILMEKNPFIARHAGKVYQKGSSLYIIQPNLLLHLWMNQSDSIYIQHNEKWWSKIQLLTLKLTH